MEFETVDTIVEATTTHADLEPCVAAFSRTRSARFGHSSEMVISPVWIFAIRKNISLSECSIEVASRGSDLETHSQDKIDFIDWMW